MPGNNNKGLFIISMCKEKNTELITKFLIVLLILFLPSCKGMKEKKIPDSNSLVNTSHLDALYEEINIDDNTMGIIHIYSDYPDYGWTGDEDEGIACVDDASRAVIFYIKNYMVTRDTNCLKKSERLIAFILYMQSENGFFYNFVFENHTINKIHKNSIAKPDWWSWRAMWALSEFYKTMKKADPVLRERASHALSKAVNAIKKSFSKEKNIKNLNGIKFPAWLPSGSAADQAGVLVLALVNYFNEVKDTSLVDYINNLCDGILLMQKGNTSDIPYMAFLSWQNIWHAYGNIQSFALLKASETLNRQELKKAALNEINYFYNYLIKANFPSSFEIEKDDGTFRFSKVSTFPQIAYNFRPMIFACLEAFVITGDSAYKLKAAEISGWYYGRNTAGIKMYDPLTGRCFDGINSEKSVNLNSGAESTIEALLSIQMLEQFGLSENDLDKNSTKKN